MAKIALDIVRCVHEDRGLGLRLALLHPPRHSSQPLLRNHCAHRSLQGPPSTFNEEPTIFLRTALLILARA